MRGYGHETDGVTVVPEEAAHLAAAAKRLLVGDVTLADTAEWMTQTAGPTVYGRPWSPTTLRRRLRNPAIAGLRRTPDGELVEGAAQQIVDRATFEALEKLFSGKERRADSKPRHVHRLSGGTVICALCTGALVSRSTSNRGHGYVCETSGCGKVRISAEPLDQYVAERALARLGRPSSIKRLQEVRERFTAEAADANRAMEELRQHKDELARAFGAREMNRSQFLAAKEAAEGQRGQALAALRRGKHLDELPELTVESIVHWWNEIADAEHQRALLQLIVREVSVGPATVRGSRKFDEDRFSIRYW